MATVLVTGASGMLGQHLVPMLEAKGHIVLRPSQNELDLTNSEAVFKYIQSNPIDIVVHCAAYVAGNRIEYDDEASFF
jgi:dTDP-4-dehydrorhamnose reductase